jgi:hypothetical protein
MSIFIQLNLRNVLYVIEIRCPPLAWHGRSRDRLLKGRHSIHHEGRHGSPSIRKAPRNQHDCWNRGALYSFVFITSVVRCFIPPNNTVFCMIALLMCWNVIFVWRCTIYFFNYIFDLSCNIRFTFIRKI